MVVIRAIGAVAACAAISALVSYGVVRVMQVEPDTDGKQAFARTKTLELNVKQLFTNDEAIKNTLGGAYADIGAALQVSGLLGSDAKTPITRWWCWAGRCERTQIECKASLTAYAAEAVNHNDLDIAKKLLDIVCTEKRLAFCAETQCYGTLEFCIRGAEKPKLCRGVE